MRFLLKKILQRARFATIPWAAALSLVAQAEIPPGVLRTLMEEEVPTIRGKLGLYRLDLENSQYTYRITLDDKLIDTEGNNNLVIIDASYPKNEPARVVLLRLPTGGTACPALYRVLEIKDDGSTVRSKKIGNCSNSARSSFTQGVLYIDFPKVGRAAAESWTYQNGQLSKVAPARRK